MWYQNVRQEEPLVFENWGVVILARSNIFLGADASMYK